MLDTEIDAGRSNPLIDRLVTIGDDAEMSRTLDHMQGEIYGTLSTVQLQNTSFIYRTLADRMRPGLANDRSSSDFSGFAGNEPFEQDNPDQTIVRGQYTPPACSECAWTGWIAGYGLGGQAFGDGNARGFDYSTGGTLVAIQRALENMRWGLFYGYGESHLALNDLGQASGIKGHQAGTFFILDGDDNYYLIAAGMGYDDYQASRDVCIGLEDQMVTGNHPGWQSSAYLERGWTFRETRGTVQPFAALQYICLRQDGFIENGNDGANLAVDENDLHSFRGLLGGRLVRQFNIDKPASSSLTFRLFGCTNSCIRRTGWFKWNLPRV